MECLAAFFYIVVEEVFNVVFGIFFIVSLEGAAKFPDELCFLGEVCFVGLEYVFLVVVAVVRLSGSSLSK